MEEEKEMITREMLKVQQRKQYISIIFLIVLIIAIAALITATIVIYNYKDLLKNPIGENLNQFGINYCTCYDYQNRIIPIKSTNYSNVSDQFIPKPQYANSTIQKLNISLTGN